MENRPMDTERFNRLQEIDKEIVKLEDIVALLQWDEETQMPVQEITGRSEQISLIQGMIFDRQTASEVGDLLGELDHTAGTDFQRALVRVRTRDYVRQESVPRKLITDLSSARSYAQAAWAKARENNDFKTFKPHLERIVSLKREWAEAVGYHKHPYDPLIDEYEPGMTSADVSELFDPMEKTLTELVDKLSGHQQPDDRFLYKTYPKELQDSFGRMILKDMDIDHDRFTMTESVHPFTTTVGSDDVRITTRYSEPAVTSALFSTIHEGGHALYELGASNEITRGTSLAQGTSLAIHESQSRFWENMVGRSPEFWSCYFPTFKEYFHEQLDGVDEEHFVRAVNRVEPTMIRVNADEVTYGLHIILRYNLEKRLIEGSLPAADARDAWNDLSKELLNITPADDTEGILQDVHWSAGLIGYFPTYALGNLYAAQFLHTIKQEHPQFPAWIKDGELRNIRQWMEDRIHRHGSIYTAGQLVKEVTGEKLDAAYFTVYLQEKYRGLY